MNSRRGTLSPHQIVEAAMAMLDQEGESRFSMRRLAAGLGVDPMALYHHHASRRALLQAVMKALLMECEIPERGGDWRDNIRALCQGLRQLARHHPGTFRAYVSFEEWVPAEHRIHEAFYGALLDGGFSRVAAVRAVRLLLAYAEAFAVDEITGWLAPLSQVDRDGLVASLESGAYPTIAGLVDEIAEVDADAEFAFGLDVLLRGLEAARES